MPAPFKVAIPARYGARRLPGKPLRTVAGQPLIQWVYDRARQAGAEEVVVATDDQRVAETVADFGGQVCLTRAEHSCGSDRLAEVALQRAWPDEAIVVNLQGDEPLMPPALLRAVAEDLAGRNDAVMATLATPIQEAEELFSPHAVKVVTDKAGFALYFTRAPVPWDRDRFGSQEGRRPDPSQHFRHIGVYAYRAGFLRTYPELAMSPLERVEALEQLRALWHGARIHVLETHPAPPAGVDTEADLARVQGLLTPAGE